MATRETIYGPSTLDCPVHGPKPVRSVGSKGTTVRCGGFRGVSGRWTHPGDITKAEMLTAESALGVLIDQHAEDGFCPDCPPDWSKAPASARREAYRLEDLVDAYYATTR